MNSDLFRRYVWLVDLLNRTPLLSYEDISARWAASPQNTDKQPFPLRTFHNHRHAIEKLFGISIRCRRGRNNFYEIADNNEPLTRMRVWMLQTLASPALARDYTSVESRIVLDGTPVTALGLITAVEAIAANHEITFLDHTQRQLLMQPYCIGFINSCWLIAGMVSDTGSIQVFDISKITGLTITPAEFRYPADFSPSQFFDNYRTEKDKG